MSIVMKSISKPMKRLKIRMDRDSLNPRTERDNIATMVCFHRRYDLGDKTSYTTSDFQSWHDMLVHLTNNEQALLIKPLYLYDHSGLTISTSPFSCQFDSGQIGYVFITADSAKAYGLDETDRTRLEEIIEAEVYEYEAYLSGNVYGFIVETLEIDGWNETDSCWGFYGDGESTIEAIADYSGFSKEEVREVMRNV